MKKIYQIDGETVFYDPGPEMLKFFADMYPIYEIPSVQPSPGFIPKFQLLKRKKSKSNKALFDREKEEAIAVINSPKTGESEIEKGRLYSALDVLFVSLLKHIKNCKLCGLNCGVNRYVQNGRCGLDSKAYHEIPFIHIAEEKVINPAIVLNLGGCSLRCTYCIESKIWDAKNFSRSNPKTFWEQVQELMDQDLPINSLEFTNPTESLHGVLAILNDAPDDINLPVVLNCHLYGTKHFYGFADQIADVWLMDLRYGNDRCAKALSSVDNYMQHAKNGLNAVINQGSKVIVRILVLPGHLACCHKKSIELLSRYRDKLWVSILDQYIPEHQAHLDSKLCKRPNEDEILEVGALEKKFGLRDIVSDGDDFWLT